MPSEFYLAESIQAAGRTGPGGDNFLLNGNR